MRDGWGDVMLTETIPGAHLSYKEKLRLTKTIPVDLSKVRIDERGYTYIDKGDRMKDDVFCERLDHERMDRAAEEIEGFLDSYNFDDPGGNHKKALFNMHWKISSLNARLMAKLTERYGN